MRHDDWDEDYGSPTPTVILALTCIALTFLGIGAYVADHIGDWF